jgi:hypothetical protein
VREKTDHFCRDLFDVEAFEVPDWRRIMDDRNDIFKGVSHNFIVF